MSKNNDTDDFFNLVDQYQEKCDKCNTRVDEITKTVCSKCNAEIKFNDNNNYFNDYQDYVNSKLGEFIKQIINFKIKIDHINKNPHHSFEYLQYHANIVSLFNLVYQNLITISYYKMINKIDIDNVDLENAEIEYISLTSQEYKKIDKLTGLLIKIKNMQESRVKKNHFSLLDEFEAECQSWLITVYRLRLAAEKTLKEFIKSFIPNSLYSYQIISDDYKIPIAPVLEIINKNMKNKKISKKDNSTQELIIFQQIKEMLRNSKEKHQKNNNMNDDQKTN